MEKGIKETKEVFVAMPEFVGLLYAQLKDGVQFEDALIIAAGLLKEPILSAVNGADEIPAELLNLDIDEIGELIKVATDSTVKTLKVFKS